MNLLINAILRNRYETGFARLKYFILINKNSNNNK
jgi:hypothetical protein